MKSYRFHNFGDMEIETVSFSWNVAEMAVLCRCQDLFGKGEAIYGSKSILTYLFGDNFHYLNVYVLTLLSLVAQSIQFLSKIKKDNIIYLT